jgi:hypothetical protein
MMNTKVGKVAFTVAALFLAGLFAAPSAYADPRWNRGVGRHSGWNNRRPVYVRPVRPCPPRPYHVTRYYYEPRYYPYYSSDVTYYDYDRSPSWGFNIESDGDVGFHAEW